MVAQDASDDFESYPLGTLDARNGGTGWGGAWSTSSFPVNIVSGGLWYANGEVLSNGGMQSLEITPCNGDAVDNVIRRALGSAGAGTTYLSLVYRVTVNPSREDDLTQFGFQQTGAQPLASVLDKTAGEFSAGAGTLESGQTVRSGELSSVGMIHFLVVKVEINAVGNKERVSIFVDPSSSSEPDTPDAVALLDTGMTQVEVFSTRVVRLESGDSFHIDNIRIGTTWTSVVPIGLFPKE